MHTHTHTHVTLVTEREREKENQVLQLANDAHRATSYNGQTKYSMKYASCPYKNTQKYSLVDLCLLSRERDTRGEWKAPPDSPSRRRSSISRPPTPPWQPQPPQRQSPDLRQQRRTQPREHRRRRWYQACRRHSG